MKPEKKKEEAWPAMHWKAERPPRHLSEQNRIPTPMHDSAL